MPFGFLSEPAFSFAGISNAKDASEATVKLCVLQRCLRGTF